MSKYIMIWEKIVPRTLIYWECSTQKMSKKLRQYSQKLFEKQNYVRLRAKIENFPIKSTILDIQIFENFPQFFLKLPEAPKYVRLRAKK